MKKLLLTATVVAVAVTAQATQDPETVFNRTCSTCHDGQLPMASEKDDHAAWEPWLVKGMPTLVQHVTNGFNTMPPRGLCTDYSARDYQATIQWMVKKQPKPIIFHPQSQLDQLINKLLVSLLLTLGLTGPAHAAGDAAAGQAKAAVHGACHGMDGNSSALNFPKLAGQGERYLLKQMHDIRDGKRTVLEMAGLLTNLSDQDLADIVAYLVSQKMSVGTADPNLVAQDEALFRGGKIAEGMPAYTGCHSPSGIGIATAGFPHLGGQHATYVAKQLTDFHEGTRTNDGDTEIVQPIAAKLSNRDIAAVPNYIQGLY